MKEEVQAWQYVLCSINHMGNRCQLQGLVEKETSLGLSIKKTFMKDAVFEVGLKMFAPLDDEKG